jgi:hypothetical protein
MNEIFKNYKHQTLKNAVEEAYKEHQLVVTIRGNKYDNLSIIFKT